MGERFFVSTNGFRLGLDWSKPAESIDLQSLTQAINCEYSSTDGALQTVPGVEVIYTHERISRACIMTITASSFTFPADVICIKRQIG